ncbi:histidine kinase [Hymenobacter sp. M29]|uniref:histidine kinase n=1 Tax=Hymenobacter mellowenesis TaxID=3063995 RepID=A0ABT9A8Q6_9BACT|nr:ATP-binding protein [Hymenobacter sp. M29]MDO7845792.1 histidine kinase [Hymenobacter sp. M29]
MRRFLFLLLLALLGAAGPGRAQTWQRDPLLGRLLIHELVQDSAGLLWVAADEGVFRYDGYELVPLPALTSRPGQAGIGYAQALVFDTQQNLWIGSANGLFCLRGRELMRITLPEQGAVPPRIYALVQHPRSHDIWVSYDNHLAYLPAGQLPARPVPSPLRAPATWLRPDGAADMWMVSVLHELGHGPPAGVAAVPVRTYLGELQPVPGTQPLQLVGSNALYEAQPDGELREVRRWLPGPNVNNFSPGTTPGSWQWVVARQLVELTWPAGQRLPTVARHPVAFEREGQLSRQYTVYTDASGLRWSASPGQRGCFKERATATGVDLLPTRPLRSYSTRAISRLPDGRLLVSAYGATLVQAADSPRAPLRPLPLTEAGRPTDAVLLDVATTPAGQVFFAEENHAFGQLDPRTGQVTRLAWTGTSSEFTSSLCLLRDLRGRLWGGTTRGLYLLDAASQQARPYPDAAVARAGQQIQKLAAGPDGILWLATKHGLYRLNPATHALTHYGPAETGPRRFPTDDVLCLWPTPDGRVWAGTRDQGLLLLDPARGVAEHLTTASGLLSNTVGTLLPGGPNELWGGTYAGLLRYNLRTRHLSVLTEEDGLADAEFNRLSAWREADGSLLFGGVGGVCRVRPAPAPASPPRPPRLLLTAYTQHLSALDTTRTTYLAGPAAPALTLAPHDAFLELSLALTDYRAPERARFQYRLRGSGDSRWRGLGTAHVVALQGLPAGEYELEMQGVSARGEAARNLLRVPLRVQALWWRQPWAWLLAAAIVAAGLYVVHRRRLARVRHDERLRSRIAADLHDEVGTLLTRVNMQAELLHQAQPAPSPAFDRLLTNSRAAASTMRDIVWGIDAQADTVGALLDRMRDHLDQTAAPAGLNTHLATDGLPDALPLPPELRQHLYLVFKEAVTNAARHARQATDLWVSLTRAPGQLRLEVRNNGPAAGTSRSGMGLRSMRQRAEALRGTLDAGPEPEDGFRVRLVVPF